MTTDFQKKQKSKNLVLLAILLGLVAIVYGITLVKFI